ncbi:hypothetical protein EJ02DRAFT_54748 [Clathrospora elynae]|uniref:Uncharacterized protein n=1 Tax=Clathrospora elynae TaxID=706981 RepID=A0A6A5SBY0_9PLEO|nr:hypothetical protein EJ02DRAFT_54748 [Clathrospora elynae]
MAAMCAAEKLLNRRHAAIKPQANTCKKIKPREMVTKKTGPQGGIIKARLPVNIAPPENRRMQSRTANEACEALQRRRAIKNMAFYAADGCPTNVDIIEQINAHFYLKERHPKIEVSDVTFKIENMNIRASQLPQGSVERNWISRYNVMIHNVELIERRLLNIEDHEVILMQLFPMERDHILKLKHFEIFVAGLGEEGIFTKSQANTIAKLGVTTEEYDKGAQFTGLSVHPHAHRRNPTSIATFDIPKQPSRANASFSPHPLQSPDRDPHYYLRTLVEAAAYKQNFWKGYFFPNACSQLDSYFQAHKLSQEGFLLCPTLTDYKRDWTHRESRTLQRGQLICELLFKYDNNSLTDYGIIRAVRATYVQIPGQPFFNAEDLESFLYHRIPESGLDIFNIPDILTLHPENDTAFSTARLRQHVIDGLLDRAELFEAEEQQRCLDIEHSFAEFEIARKKDMSAWQRVKASVKTMFGRMEIVAPFDPFAPEHCEEEEEEEKGKEVAPELVG